MVMHSVISLMSAAIFVVAVAIFVWRAARGEPLVREGQQAHWTEAISGGRWSAAAATGISVAFVAGTKAAWIVAALGLAFSIPTVYATVLQIRRRQF
jgi:hypothetical protein